MNGTENWAKGRPNNTPLLCWSLRIKLEGTSCKKIINPFPSLVLLVLIFIKLPNPFIYYRTKIHVVIIVSKARKCGKKWSIYSSAAIKSYENVCSRKFVMTMRYLPYYCKNIPGSVMKQMVHGYRYFVLLIFLMYYYVWTTLCLRMGIKGLRVLARAPEAPRRRNAGTRNPSIPLLRRKVCTPKVVNRILFIWLKRLRDSQMFACGIHTQPFPDEVAPWAGPAETWFSGGQTSQDNWFCYL